MDLIDRQAAIKAIEDLPNCYNGYSDTYDKAYIIGTLEELPSAQPELVRCKDCRHGVDYYHEGDCYCSNPKWGLNYFGGSWEFYCADAERRTEEDRPREDHRLMGHGDVERGEDRGRDGLQ